MPTCQPASDQCSDFARRIELEEIGDGRFAPYVNDSNIEGEIFGGQYLGQSMAAAQLTAQGYVPQMMAAFFLRDARADRTLEFIVERTRSGRKFAHRQVSALQDGREVFRSQIAFGVPADDAPRHQVKMPDVSALAELKSLRQLAQERAEQIGEIAVHRLTSKSGWDVFPLEPDACFGTPASQPAGRFWVKAALEQGSVKDRSHHYAMLAYLSDAMANWSSRAVHASNAYDGTLSALSLNHCVWFHSQPNIEDGFLFNLESCQTSGGIGSNRGLIFGTDGTLVASVAQDAMVRFMR